MKELNLVSFEQAKILKLAGFYWKTTCFYSHEYTDEKSNFKLETGRILENFNSFPNTCSAPVTSLALKWYRDIHNVSGEVYASSAGWRYQITKGCKDISGGTVIWISNYGGPNDGGAWDIYEEAESSLLDKLLEIIL